MTSPPKILHRRGRKKIIDQAPVTIQLGHTLRTLRETHHYSQEDIATRLGVSYQQVQKYETGKNRLPLEGLLILKNLYNVDFETIFYGIDLTSAKPPRQNSEDLYIAIKLSRLEDLTLKRKIEQVVNILCG